MPFKVIPAPHANVNDLELTVVRWLVAPWAGVTKGQVVCELETTKATIELESEHDGFLYPAAAEKKVVKVGEPVAYVFPTPDASQLTAIDNEPAADANVIVSSKARELMSQFGLVPADFPLHTSISSDTVIAKIRERGNAERDAASQPACPDVPSFGAGDVLILGQLNLGTLTWDALSHRSDGQHRAAAYVATDSSSIGIAALPVFAETQLSEMKAKGLRDVFVCPGGRKECEALLSRIAPLDLNLISVTHPSASVSPSARIGCGVFIGAGAIIGPEVEIGDFTNVLAGATVAHHSRVGRFASIADGAHLGGNVLVDDGALIGIGAAVNKRVHIGSGAIIVSGATAIDNVPADHVLRHDGSIAAKR